MTDKKILKKAMGLSTSDGIKYAVFAKIFTMSMMSYHNVNRQKQDFTAVMTTLYDCYLIFHVSD